MGETTEPPDRHTHKMCLGVVTLAAHRKGKHPKNNTLVSRMEQYRDLETF